TRPCAAARVRLTGPHIALRIPVVLCLSSARLCSALDPPAFFFDFGVDAARRSTWPLLILAMRKSWSERRAVVLIALIAFAVPTVACGDSRKSASDSGGTGTSTSTAASASFGKTVSSTGGEDGAATSSGAQVTGPTDTATTGPSETASGG